jgi:hypothetical protein
MLEREQKIAIRLLITGSGVRVPHNPLVLQFYGFVGSFWLSLVNANPYQNS